MITLIIAATGIPTAGVAGIYAGIKLRGWIPMNVPSNKIRLDNAKTDVEIAKLAVEKKTAMGELDYLDVAIEKRINEERQEQKALTTSSDPESARHKLMIIMARLFPDEDWDYQNDTLGLVENIETNVEDLVKAEDTRRLRAENVYHALERYIRTRRSIPLYLETAFEHYRQEYYPYVPRPLKAVDLIDAINYGISEAASDE